MTSVAKKTLALCLAGILVSCTSSIMPKQLGTNSEKQSLKQYLTNNQYGLAIDLLEKRVRNHPSRRNKYYLNKVKASARKFENEAIANSQQKVKRGDWQQAFIILDDALDLYPDSIKIKHFREQITRQQTQNIKLTNIKLWAVKSDYLLRKKPLYAELSKLKPNDSDAQWQLKKTNIEISETAKTLFETGRVEMKKKRYDTALKYLELAHQLKPIHRYSRELANLVHIQKKHHALLRRQTQRKRAALANKPMSTVQRSQQSQLKKLNNRIKLHLKYGNYDKAKNLLSEAEQISPTQPEITHPQIVELKSEMYNSVNRKISALIHIGNEQYSQGHIKQARRSWTHALKLDPTNKQIINSVDRANRVLSKLREIKEQKKRKTP